jgi:FKBP-type peptidyl-prolyl cis-trans isomerase
VVKYTGTLTTGFKFDENLTGFSELLGRLVIGWQKGLPLIKAGGSMSLYIPPTLGYGSQDIKNSSGAVIIPANSILIFTIQLVAVQ